MLWKRIVAYASDTHFAVLLYHTTCRVVFSFLAQQVFDIRGRTENGSTENESNGGWITQVRKMEVQTASNNYAFVENANAENRSTNLRRVNMQVWKTQVLICGVENTNVKHVYCAFRLACLILN